MHTFSQKAEKLLLFYVMEVLERAQELESEGKSVIHLEIGEPDFPTAPHICESALLEEALVAVTPWDWFRKWRRRVSQVFVCEQHGKY